MLILGIETSCDDTACSIIEASSKKISVLSSVVSSQIKLHAKWGGVVPNLAAREHLKNIVPVVLTALKNAKINPSQIDLMSVTQGPGLIPALLIGTNFSKALAYLWKKPLLGIHHIEGHIYANFIGIGSQLATHNTQRKKIRFPVLCLVVSGGHTQLVLMKKHLDYKIIGETLDDAAGEAFDKVARILRLGYPGGPAIAEAAKHKSQEINFKQIQNPKSKLTKKFGIHNSEFIIHLPRPMIHKKNFDFSFSGLKTAVLYEIHPVKSAKGSPDMREFNRAGKHPNKLTDKNYITAVATEFQQAVIDVLVSKTLKAAEKFQPKTIMLAGGVSANQELRRQLGEAIKKKFHPVKSTNGSSAVQKFNRVKTTNYHLPPTTYCIDNATMIASAAYFRWQKMNAKQKKSALINWKKIEASANLNLSK
ncbi:MAG: tRNA (adenosine(37)-N6)-threonylcarbamoyltransferase complex transferase subunit TsaD [Candidatus Moranbacteria bacterium CG10_big_fil_rev_8_21_14_0_10_35_21]|nr:MAG: tRNA (adenosine(37)-N6)-threonylcarbamoyltransferase complex transferase subunit TsaD [Candidatus Moranbacteria bacterium CG10_big_fil_rev_8_21_14_0_10_35_21]